AALKEWLGPGATADLHAIHAGLDTVSEQLAAQERRDADRAHARREALINEPVIQPEAQAEAGAEAQAEASTDTGQGT
ncbi:MAG: hypothetical protein J2P25_15490, partial [Nocardiopsaceae bacterium]|nr:hypothetical protein [Nocardiopsaceae bacterium]